MKKLLDIAMGIRWKDKLAAIGRTKERRDEARLASAKALVKWGRGACFCQKKASVFMADPATAPSGKSIRRHVGGLKGCIATVREGGWEPADETWTRDFVHGLKLAGALRRLDSPGSFYVPFPSRRRWLVESIEAGLPVSCRGKGEFSIGGLSAYAVRSFYLGEMPASDPSGVGVLAGVLAGSMKVRKEDGLWLAMKRSDELEWLLGRWTVAHVEGKGLTKWNRQALTSPFYAAVFRWRMPDKARLWMEGTVKPAWCPLLPMAMWQMAFDEKGVWGMPFPGALPWGRGRREASRMGVGLKGLKLAVMNTCGVTGVGSGLREEMVACYERAKRDEGSRLVL